MKLKRLRRILLLAVFLTTSALLYSHLRDNDPISLFPINHYDQKVADWIKPTDPNYEHILLNAELQQSRYQNFYNHLFGTKSPWNGDYVNKIVHHSPPDDLKTNELEVAHEFNNKNKPANLIGYGENFRPHTQAWMDALLANANINQFSHLEFNPEQRGIAIDNLHARVLPTDDVHFYNHKLAGQGFPFDNFQISSLWAGTPVYILGESRDHAWYLVISPDYIAWVKSAGIARVDSKFVNNWTAAAKIHLAAITHTETSITDESKHFRFLAYVGSVFPAIEKNGNLELLIPEMNINQQAVIHRARVASNEATMMPLTTTPHHFADIMNTLIGRPYGWGNLYFYNDCSAELKSLYTPFGIWLPRHSANQAYAGESTDLTAASPKNRLNFLLDHGHPFMTLVYIGGHIFMYVGNYPNPNSRKHETIALTYQNVWGIRPNPPVKRAIIGKAVLFPLLLKYPEDHGLVSQAARTHFLVSFFDQSPNYLMQIDHIDMKSLILP